MYICVPHMRTGPQESRRGVCNWTGSYDLRLDNLKRNGKGTLVHIYVMECNHLLSLGFHRMFPVDLQKEKIPFALLCYQECYE